MDTAFFDQDVNAYTTPGERAAYRAGMSTAAALCDAVAKETERSNATRSGRTTRIGHELAAIARACGDRIWDMRERIKVGGD